VITGDNPSIVGLIGHEPESGRALTPDEIFSKWVGGLIEAARIYRPEGAAPQPPR
jgi:hypothetical protein